MNKMAVDQAQEVSLSSTKRAIDKRCKLTEQDMVHYLVILVLEAPVGCQWTTQLLLGFKTEVLKQSMPY
jgi:hypothetical protein